MGGEKMSPGLDLEEGKLSTKSTTEDSMVSTGSTAAVVVGTM